MELAYIALSKSAALAAYGFDPRDPYHKRRNTIRLTAFRRFLFSDVCLLFWTAQKPVQHVHQANTFIIVFYALHRPYFAYKVPLVRHVGSYPDVERHILFIRHKANLRIAVLSNVHPKTALQLLFF
jgi:hypothetical protein